MKVIPKTESLDAFHLTDLDQVADVYRFARTDDGGEGAFTVQLDGHQIRVTVSVDGQIVVVNRGDWMVRRSTGKIDVMSDEQFNATFQRSFV